MGELVKKRMPSSFIVSFLEQLIRLICSDSLNSSLREMFIRKQDSDCQVSISAMCQEGTVPVKEFKVDLNEGK